LSSLGWIHPYLFAAYPVLALFAANAGEFPDDLVIRPLLLALLTAFVLQSLSRLLMRDIERASIAASSMLLFLFSYGHIYQFMKNWSIGTFVAGRHRFLLPLLALLLLLWLIWLLRQKRSLRNVSGFLLLVGLVLIVFPAASLTGYFMQEYRTAQAEAERAAAREKIPSASNSAQLPDIYYIILDGYGRSDILSSLYNLDTEPFLSFLDQQGFYIAAESHSNYPTTAKSLAASLNMSYLDDLAKEYDLDLTDRNPFESLLKHSRVRTFLEQRGYQTVAFETGWIRTEITDADRYMHTEEHVDAPAYLSWYANEFELLLLRTTILRPYLDVKTHAIGEAASMDSNRILYQRRRDTVRYTFRTLEEIPTWDGKFFVFAHIIIPHPPFVFGPDGEPLYPTWPYTIQDASDFPGTLAEYISGYSGQVRYTNKLLHILIPQLINRSDTAPVIILQGDHGPRAHVDWNSPSASNMQEVMSILNAYYFPGEAAERLYPSVTPVNSFRILFDEYFNADFPLLEDHSYFTTHTDPYQYIPVDRDLD
jgi:hypothetical protein